MSIQQLTRLPDEIKRDITKVMRQVAQLVPNKLATVTPVDTGHLKRSWKGFSSILQARIRNTAFYSDFVEYGTKKMAAQPMITPMLPSIEAEIERAILTGTDFYLKGSAFSDPATQLKQGYQSKYGNYGSHKGYRG